MGRADLVLIWTGAALVLAVLALRWQRLVTSSLNEELAMAAGIDPRVERLVLSLALAVVVALAIRVVGSLLISAMLIVPAAAVILMWTVEAAASSNPLLIFLRR